MKAPFFLFFGLVSTLCFSHSIRHTPTARKGLCFRPHFLPEQSPKDPPRLSLCQSSRPSTPQRPNFKPKFPQRPASTSSSNVGPKSTNPKPRPASNQEHETAKVQPVSSSGGGSSGDDPHSLMEQLVDVGREWADKSAAAELLEETKKTLLAQLTVEYLNKERSKSAAEAKAMASTEYRGHIEKMVEARRQANTARVRYDSLKVYLNLVRTYEASRRAEMQML